MASTVFGAKQFKPSAPDKGSFPLDHQGECKHFYFSYMICLKENGNQNTLCRDEAKNYLGCRMDKNLMVRENWDRLGFQEESQTKASN